MVSPKLNWLCKYTEHFKNKKIILNKCKHKKGLKASNVKAQKRLTLKTDEKVKQKSTKSIIKVAKQWEKLAEQARLEK